MDDEKHYHLPIWHKAEPAKCDRALMVIELSFYGIWPAGTSTWGECYPVEQSTYQVSLMLWALEVCRVCDITTYIETVYDEKWHGYTGQIDPRFIRLWIPIEDQLRISQFLQQASLSILPTTDSGTANDSKKRKAAASPVLDIELDPTVGHRLIKSKYALIKAVMHNSMGLLSKAYTDIDLDVPPEDTDFSPNSPMQIWDATAMFNDSMHQNRWAAQRVPPWQRNLSSYLSGDGMFLVHPTAQSIPGIFREMIAGDPWMADHTGPSIDVLCSMALPHVCPPRAEVEAKIRENARAAGNSVSDITGLSTAEFWSMFSKTYGGTDSEEAVLVDPINFAPIEYRPKCHNMNFDDDTAIMEALYNKVLVFRSEILARQLDIEQLMMSDQVPMDELAAEVEIVKERIVHTSMVQMQSACDGVPESFCSVYNECVDKLMPSMQRAKASGSVAWEMFHMGFALQEQDSRLTFNALMTVQKIEMAASPDGLDLSQPQIMVWKVLFDGVMALLRLKWNQGSLNVSTTGETQLGKSQAGVAAQASVADNLCTICDGESNKATYLTGNIGLRVIDERKQQASDRDPATMTLQTMLQKQYLSYEQYYLNTTSQKRPQGKKQRVSQSKDSLIRSIADKRSVHFFCGNFRAAPAIETRCINVAWTGEAEMGNARQLSERVNASRAKRPATILSFKLWSALSVIPHVLEANGGVVGGVEEGMAAVFFALYDHIMVKSYGKKTIKPRNMRHIVSAATGIMIERLLTKVYRRSEEPWKVPPMECLNAMRNGGYVLSMEDMLTAYLNVVKTADARKAKAHILGGLKSLIDFGVDNHPTTDLTDQYYILRAEKRNVHELLREIIPGSGEGLIQTYVDSFLQEKDVITKQRVLYENKEGKLQLLRRSADTPGVISGSEMALRELLCVIRDEEFYARSGDVPDPKFCFMSYDETSLLMPQNCIDQFLHGSAGPYAERFSGLKDTYAQGIFFWTQKGFIKHFDTTGRDDLATAPTCLALLAEPRAGFAPCKAGGMFDYRKTNEDGQTTGFLAHKMPFQKPFKFAVSVEHLDANYEQRRIFANDLTEAPTRTLVDVCMMVSGEAAPGQLVFFGLSNQCDDQTCPARLHEVKAPPQASYTIANPDRGSKMSSIRTSGAEPLLGYAPSVTLSSESRLYDRLVHDFKIRNLVFD